MSTQYFYFSHSFILNTMFSSEVASEASNAILPSLSLPPQAVPVPLFLVIEGNSGAAAAPTTFPAPPAPNLPFLLPQSPFLDQDRRESIA